MSLGWIQTVQAIENHQYDPVRQILADATLDYSDLGALVDSPKKGPSHRLARVREPDDERVLREIGGRRR